MINKYLLHITDKMINPIDLYKTFYISINGVRSLLLMRRIHVINIKVKFHGPELIKPIGPNMRPSLDKKNHGYSSHS